MNDIILFLLHHWALSGAFILLVIAVIYLETKGSARGVKKISSQQAVQLINRENALVVDVREINAYKEGHILNAIHVLPSELSDNKRLIDRKGLAIILVCSNGMQSPALAANLVKQGFSAVYYLSGGIASWKAEHLPVVK